MSDASESSEIVAARYVFAARFHVTPSVDEITMRPNSFEMTLFWKAAHPGDEDWRFFRNNLWRGEVNAPQKLKADASDALDVPVDDVTFRELQTTPAYFEALKDEIAENLEDFRADSVDEVVNKYLGSSIRVEEEPNWARD